MNILLTTAEFAPLAKAGGLADVASALPAQWARFGQNPIVIMPKYSFIDVNRWNFKPTGLTLVVPMGYWKEYAHLWEGYINGFDFPVYLIEHNVYFDRPGIYGAPDEFKDNDRRFIFLSRATFEAAKALNFKPDILHAHDFHTAFAMAFLKSHYRYDHLFSKAAGVYTIHNLAYQGWFNPETSLNYSGFGMSEHYKGSWFEHNGAINAMKTGIMFADKITTVSPTYAREIRDPYFGEGMDKILDHRGADLVGILNGVDYDEWNPEKDEYIYSKYNSAEMGKKYENKRQFLQQWGIGDGNDPDMPLIGMVTRLAEQKGIDLLLYKLEHYFQNRRFRLALLGSGEEKYEGHLKYLKARYPDLALFELGYNNELSHKIIASSDFLLMPSRFEPCGLTQMYALKYGTIPIVRSTGGLADSVQEYFTDTGEGVGFLFWQYNADDMAYAIRRALSIYNNDPHWNIIRSNAMLKNYSSSKSALEYLKVFKWALEKLNP